MRRRPTRARGETDTAAELARRLGAVLAELDLTEVEVRVGDLTVRLARTPAPASSGGLPPVPAPARPAGREGDAAALARGGVVVEAPMVGTFYRAPSPDAAPYVREGDVVKEGHVLCIIEAMKLMNEIETKVAGRVVEILAENAQPVEYGQPLFRIDPAR